MAKAQVIKMCKQTSILPIILSMLFLFMILLVVFQNCSFNIGCGGNNSLVKSMLDQQMMKENMEQYDSDSVPVGHESSFGDGGGLGGFAASVSANNSLL
jgi:hypothetical protein